MKKTSLLLAALLASAAFAMAADMKLFYDKPAKDWETEALPIGNGRLGAMIFGSVEREQIQFNEDSLWTGDEADTGSYQNFGELFVEHRVNLVAQHAENVEAREDRVSELHVL